MADSTAFEAMREVAETSREIAQEAVRAASDVASEAVQGSESSHLPEMTVNKPSETATPQATEPIDAITPTVNSPQQATETVSPTTPPQAALTNVAEAGVAQSGRADVPDDVKPPPAMTMPTVTAPSESFATTVDRPGGDAQSVQAQVSHQDFETVQNTVGGAEPPTVDRDAGGGKDMESVNANLEKIIDLLQDIKDGQGERSGGERESNRSANDKHMGGGKMARGIGKAVGLAALAGGMGG